MKKAVLLILICLMTSVLHAQEADMMNINSIREWILLNKDASRIIEHENEYYYNRLVTDIHNLVNETTGDTLQLSKSFCSPLHRTNLPLAL